MEIPDLDSGMESSTSSQPVTTAGTGKMSWVFSSSILYAMTFFCCMVIMELTLEGIQNDFHELVALPYAITLFQFSFCFILPVILSKGESLKNLPKSGTEIVPYITLSLVVFGSTCLASMSVRYVTYPTKVIFKSTKLIPTMLVSSLMQSDKHYGWFDYLAAILLCAGAAGYGFGETDTTTRTSTNNNNNNNSSMGIMLLMISVFCDAFTPNIQQRLMSAVPEATTSHPVTFSGRRCCVENEILYRLSTMVVPRGGGLGLTASTLMTNANFVGCMGVFCWMAITGLLDDVSVNSPSFVQISVILHIQHVISFSRRIGPSQTLGAVMTRPLLLGSLIVVGMSLAMAVFAYTRLIKESGSVVAVAVATIRKVVTVILSYLVYPKVFSSIHAVSALLVILGILLSSCPKQRKDHFTTKRYCSNKTRGMTELATGKDDDNTEATIPR